MPKFRMTVNGKAVTGDVDPRTLLVQFLRENLRLTGTHVGCDTSQCGACVVHVDGKAVKVLHGAGLMARGATSPPSRAWPPTAPLHPMQEAFRENHGLQCGFCTPGMIMTAVDMVRRKGNELDDQTIREELEGNLCRCTGYHNIVKAIAAGAKAMANSGSRNARPRTGTRNIACTNSTITGRRPSSGRQLLAKNEDAKLLAGGQTLLPTMKQRLAAPADLSTSARSRACGIEMKGRTLVIGAMTRHADVATSEIVRRRSRRWPTSPA